MFFFTPLSHGYQIQGDYDFAGSFTEQMAGRRDAILQPIGKGVIADPPRCRLEQGLPKGK
jgi:hypothetical protein